MKKRLMKIILWDRCSQVVCLVCAIPTLIAWHFGRASHFTMLVAGWNIGLAAGWQFYLGQKKHTEWWRKHAMRACGADVEQLVGEAGRLVEARLKSEHINPERN